MNLRQEARELVSHLNQQMSPSPYDIAWLARIRKDDKPRWPHLIDWLLDHQYPDGSWGDPKSNDVYDRYHSTWTGVGGLMRYAWRGERVTFPQALDFLLAQH